MKGVQATGEDFDEDDFEEIVGKVRSEQEKEHSEKQAEKPTKGKVRLLCASF